tara:strand:- start:25 stop:630 length:606 start_codon:yes stop_codon:yes gene_type:complete
MPFFHHGWGTMMKRAHGSLFELNRDGTSGNSVTPVGTTVNPEWGIPIETRGNVNWRGRSVPIMEEMPASWIVPRILEVNDNYTLKNYDRNGTQAIFDISQTAERLGRQSESHGIGRAEQDLAPGFFFWMSPRAQSLLHPRTRANFITEMQNLDREWSESFQRQEQEANQLVDKQINVFNMEMELEQMQLDELIRIIDREYL